MIIHLKPVLSVTDTCTWLIITDQPGITVHGL